MPGTPLYAEHRAERHACSTEPTSAPTPTRTGSAASTSATRTSANGEETEYLLRAFQRDFDVNGPSVMRIVRTLLRGRLALKDHPDPRVRDRFAWET